MSSLVGKEYHSSHSCLLAKERIFLESKFIKRSSTSASSNVVSKRSVDLSVAQECFPQTYGIGSKVNSSREANKGVWTLQAALMGPAPKLDAILFTSESYVNFFSRKTSDKIEMKWEKGTTDEHWKHAIFRRFLRLWGNKKMNFKYKFAFG